VPAFETGGTLDDYARRITIFDKTAQQTGGTIQDFAGAFIHTGINPASHAPAISCQHVSTGASVSLSANSGTIHQPPTAQSTGFAAVRSCPTRLVYVSTTALADALIQAYAGCTSPFPDDRVHAEQIEGGGH
jgi:hypothetical protein